jgi:hypothetical protein
LLIFEKFIVLKRVIKWSGEDIIFKQKKNISLDHVAMYNEKAIYISPLSIFKSYGIDVMNINIYQVIKLLKLNHN